MASYDDFLSRVLPEVPGCPEVAAIQAIKDSAIQFCEHSLILQADHDPVSVIAKINDYDLETPVTGTRITKIMKMWYQGKELHPNAPDQIGSPLAYNKNIGGFETTYNDPQVYFQKDSATFSLFPIPEKTVASAITMRVALAPLRSSTTCDDILFEHWAEPIAYGAVGRLMLQPAKSYTNPELSRSYQARFIIGVNEARQKASRGYTRANMSVRLRRI